MQEANPGVTDRKAMRLPPDYKGAYEKARAAAGIAPKNRRVNMLEDEDFEDDDDESGVGTDILCALRRTVTLEEFPKPSTSPSPPQPK